MVEEILEMKAELHRYRYGQSILLYERHEELSTGFSHVMSNNTETSAPSGATFPGLARFAGSAVTRDHTTPTTESWPRITARLSPSGSAIGDGAQFSSIHFVHSPCLAFPFSVACDLDWLATYSPSDPFSLCYIIIFESFAVVGQH
ncbi:hypothetical protein BO79DRAFT_219280 [Aspergillus costaricaensis CBS 115574]|uniref:Uncharacterized protein n=1 Tax=Aspergillus costaricaensis CBS 115574 TaxID=1448317 RepID=A0ACD1IAC6_9EURO|nr:hypothetical protein BO79DRAFT_219280 [Aspergillus costaricaensis CBS 115574]RAK87222.1 hypothetical protein BO79DRAFT_219280 [Aspergillus costaricaensis CBS 115574]